MKRLILLVLPLALSACTTMDVVGAGAAGADATGLKPPVVLAGTTADEKAAIGILYGYDAFLFVVDTLDAAGKLPPTSAKAQRLADTIDKTTAALKAALAAQRAGNATSFTKALNEAKAAYALAQQALAE